MCVPPQPIIGAGQVKDTSPKAVLPKIDSAPVLDTDSVLPRIPIKQQVKK